MSSTHLLHKVRTQCGPAILHNSCFFVCVCVCVCVWCIPGFNFLAPIHTFTQNSTTKRMQACTDEMMKKQNWILYCLNFLFFFSPSSLASWQVEFPLFIINKDLNWPKSFFLWGPILWWSQTGNHPQEDLVKFGYRSDMKIGMFKNLVVFWQVFISYFFSNSPHKIGDCK